MDLSFAPATRDLVTKTRAFVREVVLDVEDKYHGVAPDDDAWRVALQTSAREYGVFGPQIAVEYGGHGLGMVERAPVFEEAGYSLFGAIALNCASPDEGNQHLLAKVANDVQKRDYLGPLSRGEVRSAFAMTEPAPGAGSDPRALATTATRVGGTWRIDGQKHFITGADGAGFAIVMARTSGVPGDAGGATMFMVSADNPGWKVQRHIPTMDKSMPGGHCEVLLEGCVVADDAILGELDQGLEYAQVRLGVGRMTHCMRWLGAARRAHELAVANAVERRGFGKRMSELGLTQQLIADSEIDLAASRALILQACWALDSGLVASDETSIAKTFVSEAVGRIVDRSVQMFGGLGISEELPLARIYREVRPFRIYDGPSEVHRWAIAMRAARRARDAGAPTTAAASASEALAPLPSAPSA
jgi:acyl-CoA dehydrogenase